MTMTTTQHTPGPWIIETRLHVHAIKDANGQDLTYQDTKPQPDAGSVTSRGRSANETLSNARLIAAAPELLELVLQAYDRFTDNDFMPPNDKLSLWLEKAEALFIPITAATGGAK
jgi:hypothetical protein